MLHLEAPSASPQRRTSCASTAKNYSPEMSCQILADALILHFLADCQKELNNLLLRLLAEGEQRIGAHVLAAIHGGAL